MQATKQHAFATSKFRGFTLIEVMVALFVLSLGLMGLAGMQLGGMQSTKSAYIRSQATEIAYGIIDRIRTNSNGRTNYQNINCTSSIPSQPSCISTSGGCDSSNLADDDIYEWCTNRVGSLPGGKGIVSYDNATSIYTVTVGWTEASDANDPNKTIVVNMHY